MKIHNTFKEVISLNDDIKKIHIKLEEKTRKALKHGFKRYFKKYPYVEAIIWIQYTEFYGAFSIIETASMSKESYEAWQKEKKIITQYEGDTIIKEIKYGGPQTHVWGWNKNIEPEPIYVIFDLIEDEYMKAIFGLSVKVVATRNGFDIYEYEQ